MLPAMTPAIQSPISSPSQKIAQRQASIYRLSAILSLFLFFLWAPTLTLAPGTGCRPMGEIMITAPLILCGMSVLFLRVVVQLVLTWPKKQTALIAALVSLIPVAVLVLLQWLILGVWKIIYES
jgi:hypothetical protein